MNLKTGLVALSIATSPLSTHAQSITKTAEPVAKEVSYAIQDSIAKAHEAYGLATVKRIIKETSANKLAAPANKRAANMSMANKYSADRKMHYNNEGQIDSLFNSKHQAYRTITRDKEGKLTGYTDYTYKKDGSKNTEVIYYSDWGKGDGKFATHKYNGDGTATCISHDEKGEPVYVQYFKTDNYNGKELIIDDFANEIDAYYIK